MINAALYARVSTGYQVRGTSMESQVVEVRKWAEPNGYAIVAEYLDEAESASTTNRPNFRRMIEAAKAPKPPFEAILCWKHSRLFRSIEDAIVYKHLLLKRGVRLISITEPLEDSPTGRMIEAILMAMNEFYSANLAQESLRGLCELARQGYAPGGRPPYGYDIVHVKNHKGYTKRKYVIDEEQAAVVRQMYQWRDDGDGIRVIAARLNEMKIPAPMGGTWNQSTVYHIVAERREMYAGNLLFNHRGRKGPLNTVECRKPREEWIIVPNGIPAIIQNARNNDIIQAHSDK